MYMHVRMYYWCLYAQCIIRYPTLIFIRPLLSELLKLYACTCMYCTTHAGTINTAAITFIGVFTMAYLLACGAKEKAVLSVMLL